MSLLAPQLLVLSVVPLVVLAFGARRGASFGLAAARAFAFMLLVLALCKPVWFTRDAREHRALIVDRSASCAEVAFETPAFRRLFDEASAERPTTLVTFGASSTSTAAMRGAHVRTVELGERSSLSEALECAALAIPDQARGSITLFTDGLATDSRYADCVPELIERDLPVHVVTLGRAPGPPVVAALEPREPLAVGVSGRLGVEIVATMIADGTPLDLELRMRDGEVVGTTTSVVRDGVARGEFEWEPEEEGFLELEARIVAGGASLVRTVAVDPPRAVLYVGERISDGGATFSALVGKGFAFTRHEPRQPLPDLTRFDLAIVDDVPAASLGDANLRALEHAVKDDGLGLFACGGSGAFTSGGWHGTPLADLLPVRCTQKEEKRDPSTTLVVIIDTSGSMAGERVQLAKEVARLAMMRLLPHDKVGIVEFFGGKRWAAPIQPASNSIDLARAINRLDAGGGTVILPAIEEAWYGLQNVQTRYKHVLVLTDGGVESGAFEPLLRRMAEDGVNVSTVLIGAETHSEFLVDLANWGKGRFYAVPDRFNLPEILLKQPSTSRLPAYEPGVLTVRAKSGASWLGGVDSSAIASLAGYVETETKDAAQVILEVESSRAPLLATWQYGLGRVTAFTSEPCGPGTAPWRNTPAAGALFARVLERTAGAARPRFDVALERRGAVVTAIARRRAGTAIPAAEFEIRRADAPPAREAVRFVERAAGWFVATRFVAPTAEVRLEGTVDGADFRRVSNVRADERSEFGVPADRALDLERLARATGGLASSLDALVPTAKASTAGTRMRQLDLAPWLTLAALLLWLVEIYQRRRDRVVVPVANGGGS